MLKTVSSITNAIGALNYKGTWNASTNTPALASGTGTKGDYYQVSVAGSTALDGISNWGAGDVVAFNGTTWQRIEGGADLNGVNLSVSGVSTLSALTASTALALDASKNVVSVTNTGSGSNVLATSPFITTPTSEGAGGTGATLHTIRSVSGGQPAASILLCAGDVQGWNANGTAMFVSKINGNGRSINAGGTINASGTDYAEYIEKCGDFTIAKGDVCGIDENGKLTNVFADSVTFVVKSTDPSYVGGDSWGTEENLGAKRPEALDKNASAEDKTAHDKAMTDFNEIIEIARQKVDRIAFAGQVPVNVLNAVPGQYIVPDNKNGSIIGIAKSESEMTLSDYMKSVGKVIAIEQDGRAKIIVKVS